MSTTSMSGSVSDLDLTAMSQSLKASSSSSQPRVTKQKLKLSCDQCAKLKTKCAKQQPSCERCSNKGIPCIYSSAMRYGKRKRENAPLTESGVKIDKPVKTVSLTPPPEHSMPFNWPGTTSLSETAEFGDNYGSLSVGSLPISAKLLHPSANGDPEVYSILSRQSRRLSQTTAAAFCTTKPLWDPSLDVMPSIESSDSVEDWIDSSSSLVGPSTGGCNSPLCSPAAWTPMNTPAELPVNTDMCSAFSTDDLVSEPLRLPPTNFNAFYADYATNSAQKDCYQRACDLLEDLEALSGKNTTCMFTGNTRGQPRGPLPSPALSTCSSGNRPSPSSFSSSSSSPPHYFVSPSSLVSSTTFSADTSGSTPNVSSALRKTDKAVEQACSIMKCPCHRTNSSVRCALTMVFFEVLSWYETTLREFEVVSHKQRRTASRNGRTGQQGDDYREVEADSYANYSLSVSPMPQVNIGGYELKAQDSMRILSHLFRAKIEHVRSLLKMLSTSSSI